MAISQQEEELLVGFLTERIVGKAAGRTEPECFFNHPKDRYFIGNLRPRESIDDLGQATYFQELLNKLSPVAFGADFRLDLTKETTVNVLVTWNSYYRIFPTFEQQAAHQQGQRVQSPAKAESQGSAPKGVSGGALPDEEDPSLSQDKKAEDATAEQESPEVAQTPEDRKGSRIGRDSLFICYRKIECHAQARVVIPAATGPGWSPDLAALQKALDAEVQRAAELVAKDPERIRTGTFPDESIRVPETALASKTAFSNFCGSLKCEVVPAWRWEAAAQLLDRSQERPSACLAFQLINSSPRIESDPERKKESPNTERFFFDVAATFSFSRAILPFKLDLAPKGFRYDRRLWGRGFNCAIDQQDDQHFRTTHTPIHRQLRYQTQTRPRAPFSELARDPFPVLDAILKAMNAYRSEWEKARSAYKAADPDWEKVAGKAFQADMDQFAQDTAAFAKGIDLLRTQSDLLLAFRLTNETFLRAGEGRGRESWRLFQIVFLVTQIESIGALADVAGCDGETRNNVDIIYFPTGGGKTEAYLAVIIFHLFFDRLRGKTAGVSVWTRFPLRLLTLQQTQRVGDVVGNAELIRKKHADHRLSGKEIDPFAVGYFVGAEATPNEIVDPEKVHPNNKASAAVIWNQAMDEEARQNWQRITRCPSCKTASVRLDFDSKAVKLIHRCKNKDCAFANGIIPVYVVDNEIYRHLPAVIVGTLDKLASLGNQRKVSQLLGQIEGRCTEHGYYKGKCCQKDCADKKRLKKGVPVGLSGPSLFVQDELHLLKEGLGTFDGHYETFFQRLLRELGHKNPLKVIASSATIEAFQRQVVHLYGRTEAQARVFPGPGPTLLQSFYAETLDVAQRIFVGILPHNKTIFNAVLEIIEIYHREIQTLQMLAPAVANPYGGALRVGSDDWNQLLNLYATSLSYFLAGRELNSIRTDIEGDVNPSLEREGYRALELHELTGSTTTDQVSRILDTLETRSDPRASDAVLATSMVSHGVDIDRLNAMLFYGMPRQNAEYIQASSRIGRANVGLVLVCLHPARERDQSHYSYFRKYHEFLGQLVEPVAINRWSRFSINRTIPGLFTAMLLQLQSNRDATADPNKYYMLDFLKQKISAGELKVDDFIPFLEDAYLVSSPQTPGEMAFREDIRMRIQQFFDQIISQSSGRKFVSEALIPKPMRSLRDVDEAIEIELDSLGSSWAART